MTHNDKVLRLLSDGKPHTHHEGYALNVILHSRVADLRKRGHIIEQWRDGDDYLYRLKSSPAAAPPVTATVEEATQLTLIPGPGAYETAA